MSNALIDRMHQSTPRASLFMLSVEDYRAFVREWLAAPGPLREPVPAMFNGRPLVVIRDSMRSYAVAATDLPEIWVL